MKQKNNNKIKENPIMVKPTKVKDLKIRNYEESENEIKTLIIIVIIIGMLICLVYGLTELLKKNGDKNSKEVVTGVINYDKVSVGTILNRPYNKYYVFIFDSEASKAVLYSTILTKYMQNSSEEDYIKTYYCDLGNTLNNKYYNINKDGKSNPNASSEKEFNFGDITLLEIDNGKITKYIEDYEEIKEILK